MVRVMFKVTVRALCIVFIVNIWSCSGGADYTSQGDVVPPPPSSDNYLRPTAFSNNVLKLESRFVSYSKKADRVSIIDPLQEIELWGRTATGFDFALALPDFQGASVFATDRVLILSGDQQKTFSLTTDYRHMAAADQYAAYSMASADGQSLEVIRSLGAGLWQHETFNVPWEAIDPQLTSAPQGQPALLVTHFNDNGTRLTAFAPADGRFAIFEAQSTADSLENTDTWCVGDGVGTPDNATFLSLAWDRTMGAYYAGDKNGNLYAMDPSAGCIDIAGLHQIALPESSPVIQIAVLSPGRLGVIQDESDAAGSLRIVNYDGVGFSLTPVVFDNICDVPLGSMLLAGEYIAVMCTRESELLVPEDTVPEAKDAWIDPRSYVVYNIDSGAVIHQATIDKASSAGAAIDPNTAVLYRMLEGGFGHLEITNLLSGQTRQSQGLYIKDILN
jgi:hypothetical protein